MKAKKPKWRRGLFKIVRTFHEPYQQEGWMLGSLAIRADDSDHEGRYSITHTVTGTRVFPHPEVSKDHDGFSTREEAMSFAEKIWPFCDWKTIHKMKRVERLAVRDKMRAICEAPRCQSVNNVRTK